MHNSVMDWAKSVVDVLALHNKSVLEVGSYDVNGSVRGLFKGKYLGIDLRPGPGVDRVITLGPLPFADEEFEVVVSTEMLEHDPRPWLSIPEMARVCRKGGFILVTARGFGFGQHEYPNDYWRFNIQSMSLLAKDAGLIIVGAVNDTQHPGVFMVCEKP